MPVRLLPGEGPEIGEHLGIEQLGSCVDLLRQGGRRTGAIPGGVGPSGWTSSCSDTGGSMPLRTPRDRPGGEPPANPPFPAQGVPLVPDDRQHRLGQGEEGQGDQADEQAGT